MTAAAREQRTAPIWDTLVGQRHVIETLDRAARGDGMTHAWLFTGPPGSGRSNAALAFAAALQCEQAGCGECHSCRTVLGGTHADVTAVRTDALVIAVKDVRELVRKAALSPNGQRWQVIVVEDADRLNDQGFNALLKAIEEPNTRTVWLLCAPTAEDVLVTIRSRCRLVTLTTPTAEQVADFLVRTDDVPPTVAHHAARASQGHIGRARALARDEATRNRRAEVVRWPAKLTSLGSCMNAAANLVDVAKEETEALGAAIEAREKAELDRSYGVEGRGKRPREYAPALKELEQGQKRRAKRRLLDVVDRALMDLVSVYRDAIAFGVGAQGDLVNEEIRPDIAQLARRSSPEAHLRRIDAIFTAREQMLEFNVRPETALEAMMVALRLEGQRR
ncbi:DNA polymerase III subunit delta' [Nocardioides malaquae]|uniref:DNA polymerase III subunit delta' n=1 Tax=Nocardioides malaquae TaxID=2773426 RepID=UPI0029D41866|nr:DNA polymerase III subunit delta' [Nocardioides malaquae]